MAKKSFTITLKDGKGKEHTVTTRANGIKHAIAKAKLEALNKTGKMLDKVEGWASGTNARWRFNRS